VHVCIGGGFCVGVFVSGLISGYGVGSIGIVISTSDNAGFG